MNGKRQRLLDPLSLCIFLYFIFYRFRNSLRLFLLIIFCNLWFSAWFHGSDFFIFYMQKNCLFYFLSQTFLQDSGKIQCFRFINRIFFNRDIQFFQSPYILFPLRSHILRLNKAQEYQSDFLSWPPYSLYLRYPFYRFLESVFTAAPAIFRILSLNFKHFQLRWI